MIRILWKALAFLLLLILCGISCVGVMAYMPHMAGKYFHINDMGNNLIEMWRPKQGLFLLWLACFVGTIATFVSAAVSSITRPIHIEVQMGGGKVVILDSAIRKYIKTALTDLPDVVSRQIKMRQTRHGILVDIYADVRTKDRLPDLERKVIARVRAALAEDLGITAIAGVHVYIRDIEVSSKPELMRRVQQPRESQFQLREPTERSEPRPDPFERPWNPPMAPKTSRPIAASIEKISMIQTGPPEEKLAPTISITPVEEPKPAAEESAPAQDINSAATIIDTPEKKRGFFSRWKKDRPEGETSADPSASADTGVKSEPDLDLFTASEEKSPGETDSAEKKDNS